MSRSSSFLFPSFNFDSFSLTQSLNSSQHLLRRLSLLFFSSWTRPNLAASALASFCASIHLYLPDFECFFKQSSMPRLAVSVSVPVSCGGVTGGTSGVGKGAGEGAKVGCTSAESRGPGFKLRRPGPPGGYCAYKEI